MKLRPFFMSRAAFSSHYFYATWLFANHCCDALSWFAVEPTSSETGLEISLEASKSPHRPQARIYDIFISFFLIWIECYWSKFSHIYFWFNYSSWIKLINVKQYSFFFSCRICIKIIYTGAWELRFAC